MDQNDKAQNDKVRQAVVSLLNCKVAIEKASRILTAAEQNLHEAEDDLVRVIKGAGRSAVQYGYRQFSVDPTGRLECVVFKGLVLEEGQQKGQANEDDLEVSDSHT